MTRANDFRIGNWAISYELSLNKDNIFRVNSDILVHFGLYDIKPLELTKKWLLEFGAEKELSIYQLDRFVFIWNELKHWEVFDENTLTFLTTIEFVHELQNFYFIMNKTELCGSTL